MSKILLIISTWIHSLSAVVWIGGIFFILFIALPAAKQTLEQPGKFMSAASKRFVPIANIGILLVILSGIVMSILLGKFPNTVLWTQTLFIKIMIASIMAGIHFYRGLILTPKITRLTSEGGSSEQIGKLQGLSLNLVKTNFTMGIIVLLLTGMLYTYRT